MWACLINLHRYVHVLSEKQLHSTKRKEVQQPLSKAATISKEKALEQAISSLRKKEQQPDAEFTTATHIKGVHVCRERSHIARQLVKC